MPKNYVKPGEEKDWEKAKEEAKKEYSTTGAKGKKKLSKNKFWAAVTSIFKKMAHKENINNLLKYGTDKEIKFIIEANISKEEEKTLKEYIEGYPEEDNNDYKEDNGVEATEDDIFTKNWGDISIWYLYGKIYCQGDDRTLAKKLEKDNYFPNIYSVSDHGNTVLINKHIYKYIKGFKIK